MLLYMSEFEDQYKVCMELIKQKSRDKSETDILLTAMKDLLQKLEEEEKKVEALKKKRKWPCFSFTTLHCCPVSLF